MPRRSPGAALAVAVLVALSGCAPSPTGGGETSSLGEGPSSGSPAQQTEPTITVEVYGDSLTVADSPDLRSGRTGPESWVHHARGHGVDVVGAAGRWGATAEEVLQVHLRTGEDAVEAEWLVTFLGTNDAGHAGQVDSGAFFAAHEAYVEQIGQIAERTGHDDGQVVVVSVGPSDHGDPQRARRWNELTRDAAAEQGWHLVDPWEELRAPDGRYTDPGFTTDGLHLSTAGAQRLAEGLASDLHQVARTGR